MMAFAYERFLPDGMKWRDLFDMVGGPGQHVPCLPLCCPLHCSSQPLLASKSMHRQSAVQVHPHLKFSTALLSSHECCWLAGRR